MNKHYLATLYTLAFLGIFQQKSAACGYDWISDCSSQVQLKINGVVDSFILADCPFGYSFNGVQLGSIQSIALTDAKAITWESCQNNVTNVRLLYRLYEQGFPGGAWQTVDLQQYRQTVEGPYTTRYRQHPDNLLLSNGLTPGKTYTIELYMVADVDTIGDDFIPESSFLRNNNGQNYRLSFVYGGAAAPPLALLAHVRQPSCHGYNNGVISVSTYGNLNGLFYQWSNIGLNFFQQSGLYAGTYSVTVSNALGQSAMATIPLGEPAALQVSFSNIQAAGCNNNPGSATASPSGGIAPYHYQWSTGQQSATATLPSAGNWTVTVSDASGCQGTGTVSIGGNGQIERNVNAQFCAGGAYTIGGQTFSSPGQYQFTTPGVTGCDTVTHLTLEMLNPASAFTGLPAAIDLTCTHPEAALCADAPSDIQIYWKKDGITLSQSSCFTFQQAGNFQVVATQQQCVAGLDILVTIHFSQFHNQISGQAVLQCNGYQPGWLFALTDALNPSFTWVYDGIQLAASDSCYFQITVIHNGQPVVPTLTVTDVYGCSSEVADLLVQTIEDKLAPVVLLQPTDASNPQSSDGSISATISAGTAPFVYQWDNGAVGAMLSGLAPGAYCVTVTGGNACSVSACASVSFSMGTREQRSDRLVSSPNPVEAGAPISLLLPQTATEYEYIICDSACKQVAGGAVVQQGQSPVTIQTPASVPAGVYFLQLRDESKVFSHPLLIR